jgi:hypothetical protein
LHLTFSEFLETIDNEYEIKENKKVNNAKAFNFVDLEVDDGIMCNICCGKFAKLERLPCSH